jgi:hypothetical protein
MIWSMRDLNVFKTVDKNIPIFWSMRWVFRWKSKDVSVEHVTFASNIHTGMKQVMIRYISPKRRLIFNELHGFIPQKKNS